MNVTNKRVLLPNAMHGLVPTELYLMSDGSLLFTRPFSFAVTYEDVQFEGVSSLFHTEGFKLWQGDDEFEYDYETEYRYKVEPLMGAWLRQQNLSLN